uniref:Annexin 4 n=1 Tax=Spironucleus barkhanus TaxID=103874 RepID=A0A142C656_SPIBA|nr:annexin 4 [Spironucleus barkhanus]
MYFIFSSRQYQLLSSNYAKTSQIQKCQNMKVSLFIELQNKNLYINKQYKLLILLIIFNSQVINYTNQLSNQLTNIYLSNHPFPSTMSNYKEQAEKLNKAMKGLGTDEEAIIAIASAHTAEERQQISEAFFGLYGDSLAKRMKKELNEKLESILVPIFQGRFTMWAQYINEAIKGAGTDENLLFELIFLLNDQDQQKVETEYKKLYGKELKKAIENDITGGKWAKLIRVWLNAKNDSNADPEVVADALWSAAKGAGTDEEIFMQILANCRPEVYHEACEIFQSKHNKDVAGVIMREFSGKSEDAFMAAHYSLFDQRVAVGRQLKMAFKGAGTDEEQLIRATVLFSDRVRGNELKEAYKQFGDVLKDTKRDLTGKFEKAVVSLWQM